MFAFICKLPPYTIPYACSYTMWCTHNTKTSKLWQCTDMLTHILIFTHQVNYLGHFLLTLELLPVIMETARSHGDVRIVNVSSAAHKWGTLNPSNMNGEASYSRWSFYGNSKLYIVREMNQNKKLCS